MRAAVLDRPGSVETRPLALRDLPDPTLRAGDVLVRVEVCGLCRTDLHVVEGELTHVRPQTIPGHQIVGVVAAAAPDVDGGWLGRRVGIAWLHQTCGACRFCATARENLCEKALFTGYSVDGGFAELVRAPATFVYPLPDALEAEHLAPLLCAGIIGYRALGRTGLGARGWSGARLGLYGFGAAGHVALQIARARGAEVFVCTRDRERYQALAHDLGAAWVGDATASPPVPLDAAIVFAPAGELVPVGLGALDRGGILVLGGIHMSEIPSFDYGRIYHEREIRTVANNTRDDGQAFLDEAARIGLRTHVRRYGLAEIGDALIDLKCDAIRGAAVIRVAPNG